ncbi:aldehyde reductase [soil metagenome]
MADQVLVTGGSGFIGGWCVAKLLSAGYVVRTTVRDLKRETEVRRAIATVEPAALDPQRLTFHVASLDADDGWAAATAGCRYVLHVASPVPAVQPKDPDDLIRPARDGALRVVKAAVEAGVERVVMTSSVAAVGESGREGVKDERDWTDLNAAGVTPYSQSKTIAERAVRDWMAQHGGATTLATVNPVVVLGPVMSGDFSASVQVVSRMLDGKLPGVPNLGFNMVDVRDVADLHLLAMTVPQAAGGRYIAASDFLWMQGVADILRRNLPERADKVPARKLPDWLVRLVSVFDPALKSVTGGLSRKREFSAARAQSDLGWRPRSAEESVIAAGQSLIAHGVV